MFYNLYKSIKTQLAGLTYIKHVGWYNNQYEQGLSIDTSILVEFNPDAIKQLMSKDTTAVEMPIRLYFGKKLLSDTGGLVPDTDLEQFNTQLTDVIALLDGHLPLSDELVQLTLRPLQLSGISPMQKIAGWQIWLIDFTAKVDKAALRAAIETFAITTSVQGNGTITSQPTDLTALKVGQVVAINAAPNAGSTFTGWLIDGIANTSALLTLKANKAIDAIATFATNQLVTILKSLHTAPVIRGNAYYNIDHSGNGNDVPIKQVPIATLDGVDDYGLFSDPMSWFLTTTNPWTIEIYLNYLPNNTSSGFTIFGTANNGVYPSFNVVVGNNQLIISVGNLASNRIARVWNLNKGYNLCRLTYDGGKSNYIFYLNGNLVINSITPTTNLTDNTLTVGAFKAYFTPSSAIVANIYSIRAWKSVQPPTSQVAPDFFEYYFNQGNGAVIPDLLSSNTCTLQNANLTNVWAGRIDGVEPTMLTRGCTAYRNNSTSKLMFVSKNTTQTFTGYTCVGYFPAGSGTLKGLAAKYGIVGNAEHPAGDYTSDEIAAWPTTELTEVSQNTDAVTQLILKQ